MTSLKRSLYGSPWSITVLVGVGYVICVALSVRLSFSYSPLVIWFPAGLLLGVLLVCNKRRWITVLAAAFLASLVADLLFFEWTWFSVPVAAAACVQAFAGAWVMRRLFRRQINLTSLGEGLAFVILGAIFGTMISPLVGAAAGLSRWGFPQAPYGTAWWVLWTGNMLAVLIFTPLMLAWKGRLSQVLDNKPVFRWIEAFIMFTVTGAAIWAIFSGYDSPGRFGVYLIIILLASTAYRFGSRGASVSSVLLGLVVYYLTVHGRGPFGVSGSPYNQTGIIQSYLGVYLSGAILLGATFEEHRRSSERLKESEQKVRSVIDNSPLGIFMFTLDTDRRLVFSGTNPVAAKVLKIPDEGELAGKTVEEIFPSLSLTELPERFHQAAASGIPWEAEQFEYRDMQVSGIIELRAFQTVPDSMAVMFSDVTGKIHARRALEESEEHFRAIFEASAVALWEEDYSAVIGMLEEIKKTEKDVPRFLETHPDFVDSAKNAIRFLNTNQWALDLYEATSCEELFASIDLLFSSDLIHSFTCELIALVEGYPFYKAEIHTHTLKGRPIDLLVNVAFPRSGASHNAIISALDVTPLHQAEMALKHQNAFLESLNRTAVGMMARPDMDELLHGIVEQARQLFGAPRAFIYLLDDKQGEPELVVRAISSAVGEFNHLIGFRIKANEGLSGRILASGRPLVVEDYATWEGRTERLPDYDIFHCMIGVPLKAGDRVIGVLGLMHSEPGLVFTENDVELVSRFADLASIAIDNASLYRSLGETEAKYRQIVERVNGVIYMDANNGVKTPTYVSPQIEAMLGYTPREWLDGGTDLWKHLIHPDDFPLALAEHERSKRVGDSFSLDYRMIARDGRIVWVQDVSTLTRMSEVSEPVWFGTLYDITARKKAEEELQAAEARYRDLVERFHAVFYVDDIDEQSTSLYVSPQVEKMFGVTVEEWLTNKDLWLKMIHPDDFDRISALNLHVARTGEDFNAEYRIVKPDGKVVWVRDESSLIFDENGHPQSWKGLWIDITARKHIEEALRKSESQLRAIFDSSQQAYIYMDRKCRILTFNSSASENYRSLFGKVLDEGQDLHDLIPREEVDVFDRCIRRALIGEENVHNESHFAVNGSVYWFDTYYTPVVDEDRKTIGVFYVAIDITERKQAQEMLLSQQKMADLGTLAAGMAHELNSPLQVVTGATEGLINRLEKNGSIDHDLLQRRLEMINQSGWRCANIIRSMLDYSRAPHGEKESHDLNDLVQEALKIIGHQLETWSNISIKMELAPDLPPLTCDRNQLLQVIINLMFNARDAMPRGGTITLATSYDKPIRSLVLKVRDNGKGIPGEIIKYIFNPFFTTKPLGQGTGLGLSIVMGIMNAHHGSIQVESPPGHGTTFTLVFPENSPADPPPDHPPINKSGRFDPGNSAK